QDTKNLRSCFFQASEQGQGAAAEIVCSQRIRAASQGGVGALQCARAVVLFGENESALLKEGNKVRVRRRFAQGGINHRQPFGPALAVDQETNVIAVMRDSIRFQGDG